MSFFHRQSTHDEARHTIDATDFSMQELEAAAALARAEHVTLIIENLRGRSVGDITRLLEAGGHRIAFGTAHLN